MTTTLQTLRYQLPKKSVKIDCPQCGPKHRKTWSRYMDTRTGELLPEVYGRCDREGNCGYALSPYQKTASGLSYADEVYQAWKENNPMPTPTPVAPKRTNPPAQPQPVYCIPDEVFQQSLSHYDKNQLALLLTTQFGKNVADSLLQQFHIGTSSRWPGACIFWYVDEAGRKRGGQIKLFGPDWHTEKYVDREGRKRSRTSWVHSALSYRLEKAGTPLPEWLVNYNQYGECSPCLFGLPQLQTAPADMPIGLVESPKTAIICAALIKRFTWLAVGSLSYLNAERLAPLRGRKIKLYPDLGALADWRKRMDMLRAEGFTVDISSFLEDNATDEQKQAGLDLADFLLQQPPIESQPGESEAPTEGSTKLDIPLSPSSESKAVEVAITEPNSATGFRLPVWLENLWTQVDRPPLCWMGKIRTHKALMRCLEPKVSEQRVDITTEEPFMSSPSCESQTEPISVTQCNELPTEKNALQSQESLVTNRRQTFREWQQQDPHFSQMGLASLTSQPTAD